MSSEWLKVDVENTCLKAVIKIKNELIKNYVIELAIENMCSIKEQWHSRYNKYMIYDYEPFCNDGYDCILTIQGKEEIIKYIGYLLEKRIKEVDLLNNCILQKV